MSTVLAIDPGDTESAYVVIDADTCRPITHGKIPNQQLRDRLWTSSPVHRIAGDHTVIEMIASYGMAVGEEVFETCVWIGTFATAIEVATGERPRRVKRLPVKLHHCHDSKAKDSNITRALVDRFTPGQPNFGKGTKAEPGWFHGFFKDVWQAYALAVHEADQLRTQQAVSPQALGSTGAPF